MKGFRILLFLTVLAAGSQSGFARLGESPQLMAQRYGPPVAVAALRGYTRCVYRKESFTITIFYQNGVSVLESFAARGLDEATARKVATLVAGHDVGAADPDTESQIRQASGITFKDEVFWVWATNGQAVEGAYNPLECTVAFFNAPATYANIHQALASVPLAGD